MTIIQQVPNSEYMETRRPIQPATTDRLIVIARCPEIGKVKTRLIPAIGPDQATKLHSALLRKTMTTGRELTSNKNVELELRVTGGEVPSSNESFDSSFTIRPQVGRDLGERLGDAARTAFREGVQKLVIVGTDCPELDTLTLQQAFAALDTSDLVLGPALDGGYYLIAMRGFFPALFGGIDWGSDRVLQQTKAKARQLGIRVTQTQPLSDIDYAEDLVVCRKQPEAFKYVFPETQSGVLSVVIPTFNEEHTLATTLKSLSHQKDIEVIVADGGSTDRTVDIARQFKVRIVPCRSGRGRQMNAGAALSCGEALLFLHADTTLPDNFAQRIWEILAQGAIAGSFKLAISGQQSGLRWVEAGANFRSSYFQMPYGDQSLFLLSDTFFNFGGYRHWPLMEDYELCQRMRKHGKITIAAETVTTSDRRWRELGVLRTTLLNQVYITAFRLGVSPERIAKWYRAPNDRRQTIE